MAKKEVFSYEISPFSVCYQATNVSPSFLCVTLKLDLNIAL